MLRGYFRSAKILAAEGERRSPVNADGAYAQNGFKSCNGNNAVITVWRKASY